MLNVFYGTDAIKVRKAALEAAEKGDATVTTIAGENYSEGMLRDAAGAASLFGGVDVYVLDTPSSNKAFDAEVKDNLAMLSESNNSFIVIEGALLAANKKQYAKFAESIEEFKGEKAERFNVFAMADALSKKDKKTLWVLLQEAKLAGLSAEEIIGTLWWQLKTLRLAAVTGSASEAGMKDFPYNKAKRSLGQFEDGELETLSRSLLAVYHDGHLGKQDIDLALEKWCLSV